MIMKNKTKNTALCGMLTALSVVLMLFTAVIPVFMYVLPIVTGILVLFAEKIINKKWALGVYFSVSVLSLLLLTDKESALTYCLFFGYYPVIKTELEKIPALLVWVCKLLLFNTAAVLIGVLGIFVFGLSADEYNEFGKITVPLLLAMANAVFVLYDVTLSKNTVLLNAVSQKLKKTMRL